MNKMRLIFSIIFSIPKIISFNFRAFPFKVACKLPVFVHYKTKTRGIKKGRIAFNCSSLRKGMVLIGFKGTEGVISQKRTVFILGSSGKIVFGNRAVITSGCSVVVGGILTLGNSFQMNKNSMISCNHHITIGNDVVTG